MTIDLMNVVTYPLGEIDFPNLPIERQKALLEAHAFNTMRGYLTSRYDETAFLAEVEKLAQYNVLSFLDLIDFMKPIVSYEALQCSLGKSSMEREELKRRFMYVQNYNILDTQFYTMQTIYHLAHTKSDFMIAKALFLEYAQWLNVDLCFQGFEAELADIEVEYSAPKGGIFLFKTNGEVVGCVGIRPLKTDTTGTACELKRMYIRDAYRGQGYGKSLLSAALDFAKTSGYTTMSLDTLDRLEAAIALYKQYGFVETKPYYDNPLESVRYFEKKL